MVERHELGLFERSEMEAAFVRAGLTVRYDEVGLTGRGLWIGICTQQPDHPRSAHTL